MVILVSAWSFDCVDNGVFELITFFSVKPDLFLKHASLSIISLPFLSGADF